MISKQELEKYARLCKKYNNLNIILSIGIGFIFGVMLGFGVGISITLVMG